MPTVTELLADIDLRYRNVFTPAQKVVWMNQVQNQIYQLVRHEAEPASFLLVSAKATYSLPDDCDVRGIEQVLMQTNNDLANANYQQLPYKRGDDAVNDTERFYSIVGGEIYINPIADSTTEGRKVYINYAKSPVAISVDSLTETPDLEEDFHELLVLGTLERVAGARKDVVMKNNYNSDFEKLLEKYEEQFNLSDPEFLQPIDVLYRPS